MKKASPILLFFLLGLSACPPPKVSLSSPRLNLSPDELAQESQELYQAASLSENKEEILVKTQEGMIYAQACLQRAPDHPACLYYEVLNRGLFTKNHLRGYQNSLKLMVEQCQKVLRIQEDYNSAGCHRVLGNLYARAPLLSLQNQAVTRDLNQAKKHLARAVELVPNYALNQLFYARALLEMGEKTEAKLTLKRFETLLSPILDKDYPQWKKDYAEMQKALGSL